MVVEFSIVGVVGLEPDVTSELMKMTAPNDPDSCTCTGVIEIFNLEVASEIDMTAKDTKNQTTKHIITHLHTQLQPQIKCTHLLHIIFNTELYSQLPTCPSHSMVVQLPT